MADESTESPDGRPPLLAFLRLVAAGLARGQLTRMQAATAILTAIDSDRMTGTQVRVNVEDTAIEMGVSSRSVWDHLKRLRQLGWFEQTTKPAQGRKGSVGRRATYRVQFPSVIPAHDQHVQESAAEPAHVPAGTCAGSERESCTVFPPDVVPPDVVPPLVQYATEVQTARTTPTSRPPEIAQLVNVASAELALLPDSGMSLIEQVQAQMPNASTSELVLAAARLSKAAGPERLPTRREGAA
jgi:hypothetical protein